MKTIFSIVFLLIIGQANATKIIVRKNTAISTLRQGIHTARDGDTVLLTGGIYKEGNILIRKAIWLMGIGRPVLDGEFKNEILTISGKNIRITGIHFKNAGYSSMN